MLRGGMFCLINEREVVGAGRGGCMCFEISGWIWWVSLFLCVSCVLDLHCCFDLMYLGIYHSFCVFRIRDM
jgi:hypothetical protein